VYQVVDGRARLRDVEVGAADADYRVVTRGLARGDVVVLFPGSTISDGTRLRERKAAGRT
jgi:hypothetical protein